MIVKDYVVNPEMSIIDAMRHIDKNARGIVYVCAEDGSLLGGVTDGDIRRHIIKGGPVEAAVSGIMKQNPITLPPARRGEAADVMKLRSVRSIPIVDEDNRILEIIFQDSPTAYASAAINVPVVIMAGGKGMRLMPYTQILPKPLIPIGEKTITEHIIDRFAAAGCRDFCMIVNYKKHFIESYFKDMELTINLEFVEEENYLGTAGGLTLLKHKYNDSFFMSNCDILIEGDYSKMLSYHKESKNLATIVCALKNTQLPYGVVESSEDGAVIKINEKPRISSIVNTGLYVLEPEFLEQIPENKFIHITEVMQNCIGKGMRIGMYPVSEDRWMDMGQISELEKMTARLTS
ncbi:MAG: nucleotidyltransferase family protein [Lachnospiraceae bacterium]|nr:nucleotidyltransferase family protein [Lachnospiraceae bacterium]